MIIDLQSIYWFITPTYLTKPVHDLKEKDTLLQQRELFIHCKWLCVEPCLSGSRLHPHAARAARETAQPPSKESNLHIKPKK